MNPLFKVMQEGQYREIWRAADHESAARRAAEHAEEIGAVITKVQVSRMTEPEPEAEDGFVYVRSDTLIFKVDGTSVEEIGESKPKRKIVQPKVTLQEWFKSLDSSNAIGESEYSLLHDLMSAVIEDEAASPEHVACVLDTVVETVVALRQKLHLSFPTLQDDQEQTMSSPNLNGHELATILGALRFWQQAECPAEALLELFEGVDVLDEKDVGELCERINCGGM